MEKKIGDFFFAEFIFNQSTFSLKKFCLVTIDLNMIEP